MTARQDRRARSRTFSGVNSASFRDACSRGSSLRGTPSFMGSPGWVRSSAWIWLPSSYREHDRVVGRVDVEADHVPRTLSAKADRAWLEIRKRCRAKAVSPDLLATVETATATVSAIASAALSNGWPRAAYWFSMFVLTLSGRRSARRRRDRTGAYSRRPRSCRAAAHGRLPP